MLDFLVDLINTDNGEPVIHLIISNDVHTIKPIDIMDMVRNFDVDTLYAKYNNKEKISIETQEFALSINPHGKGYIVSKYNGTRVKTVLDLDVKLCYTIIRRFSDKISELEYMTNSDDEGIQYFYDY